VAFWPLFLGVAVIGSMAWLAYWLLMRLDAETQQRLRRQAELTARADYEHR
jgi:hypothetical protein